MFYVRLWILIGITYMVCFLIRNGKDFLDTWYDYDHALCKQLGKTLYHVWVIIVFCCLGIGLWPLCLFDDIKRFVRRRRERKDVKES